MKIINDLSAAVIYLGLSGFFNNLSWIMVSKTESFDDWWYYKFTTLGLYTAAIIVYKLEELIKTKQ